jgi:hypothetical protein
VTADIETAVHYRYVGPLLATGRIPNSGEVAERLGVPVEDVRRALRSLGMRATPIRTGGSGPCAKPPRSSARSGSLATSGKFP